MGLKYQLPGTIHSAALEIEALGGLALPIQCDIRSEADIQSAIEATLSKFGGIDILVNNASAISLGGTLETSLKKYDLMNQVNARGEIFPELLSVLLFFVTPTSFYTYSSSLPPTHLFN